MKIKVAVLASILAASFPMTTKAENIEGYEEYQISCEIGGGCDDFDVIFQQPNVNFESVGRSSIV